MTQKLTFKLGFSLALVAVLVLGFAVATQPVDAMPTISRTWGTCDTVTACVAGDNISLFSSSGCEIHVSHCIGYNCLVYINNSTGAKCYTACDWQ